jgi:outer membrane assembly lipoprotein YfiO
LIIPSDFWFLVSNQLDFQAMRRPFLVLIFLLLAPSVQADPPAAEFKNGHWQPIAPPPPSVPVADPQLDHIQQLLNSGDAKAAYNDAVVWVKSHSKRAPMRDRCLYLIAESKYKIDGDDDWINAFYYLDELMEEYPDSKLFYRALQLQYTIADRSLNGHNNKFLGLPIVPMQDQAIEMLFRIQERSPGSPLAEKALLRTCDYYYSTGDYSLAHDAYGFYIKSYPRSPNLADIKLRQAFSSLAQFHGVRFDPTCLLDARAELLDIMSSYPDLAKEQNLGSLVKGIDTALAHKLLVTADYYSRTSAPHGAVYVYRYLIEVYPDSTDATAARKALEKMPKSVLADLPPRPGEAFAVPQGPVR